MKLTRLKLFAFAVPVISLSAAYGSQHFAGLAPCHLCLLQRWPHFAAAAFALLTFVSIATPRMQRILLACAAGGLATTGAIGFFHAGVEAGWWEYVSPCTTSSITGKSALESIMAAPLVRCDEVAFRFLGISMAGWNALVSISSAITIFALLTRSINCQPQGR